MKPRIPREFFINDDLSALTPLQRILFLGLLMLSADDDGIMEDRPRRIKAMILPYEQLQPTEMDAMLGELESFGLITRQGAESPEDVSLLVINEFDTRWQFSETEPSK